MTAAVDLAALVPWPRPAGWFGLETEHSMGEVLGSKYPDAAVGVLEPGGNIDVVTSASSTAAENLLLAVPLDWEGWRAQRAGAPLPSRRGVAIELLAHRCPNGERLKQVSR